MARAAAVAVAATRLGVAVAVVTGHLRLEVGEEWRGWVAAGRRTVAVGTRARTVGPRPAASAVITDEEEERIKRVKRTKRRMKRKIKDREEMEEDVVEEDGWI